MKFQALTLVAALVQTVSAAKTLSGDELNSMLRSGKIDANSLLKSAVPARNLNGNGGQAYNQAAYGILGQTGITGDYSVSFNSCVSLTAEEEWDQMENFENLQYYVQREQIQSVRNYVLFNVCETMGDCSDPSVTESNTYMVDLNTWVSAMIGYLPSQKEQYCEGCENQAEYCANYYRYKADGIDYNKAAFFYDEIKFQLIDCEQCETYGCYDENGDQYEQNGWDDVEGWIYELAQCQQTESQFNGLAEYAGFMCNSDGTGLELAVYMDQDCTLYNSMRSYRSTLGNGADDWAYYGKSQSIISYLFNYQFDCYGGDLIYVNLFQQVYMDENGSGYDPCQIDQSTGTYMNEYACQNMMYNNPCYMTYDENGNAGEANEEECQEFMEANPCWSMPGSDVADDYQEACQEYLEQYSHQANSACSALFGNNEGQEENGNQGNQQQMNEEMMFPAVALSTCAYNYQGAYLYGGQDEAQEEEQQDDAEDDENAWLNYLTYDISAEMMDNEYSICYMVDKLFIEGDLIQATVYDSSLSGQMYDYDSDNSSGVNDVGGSGSGSYFPTMPNMPVSVAKAVRRSRKMSAGAIVGLSVLVVGAIFLFAVGFSKLRDTLEDMVDDDDDDEEERERKAKELPLMT